MASVQKLDGNKYKIFVELGYNDFGKRVRRTKTVTVTSDRDLKNKIRDFEIECFTNKEETLENITFASFVDRWWKNHVEMHLAISTQESYRSMLDHTVLDYFGKMKLKKIKKLHIVDFFTQEKNNKRGRTTNKLTLLKSIFSKAVDWEVIEGDPTKKVKVDKKMKEKLGFYTEEEVKRLFEVLADVYPKHRIMIKLAVIGGMRRGEIAGIREESIDFNNNSILADKQLVYNKEDKTFSLEAVKHKKPRTIFFPKSFMEELKTYYVMNKAKNLELGNLRKRIYDDGEPVNLVFTKEDGYPARPDTIYFIWREIIDKYNLKRIRFHDLRHTCASLMVKKGVNFKVIQERLGHSDIKMTMNTYSHLTVDQEKEAANIFNDLL